MKRQLNGLWCYIMLVTFIMDKNKKGNKFSCTFGTCIGLSMPRGLKGRKHAKAKLKAVKKVILKGLGILDIEPLLRNGFDVSTRTLPSFVVHITDDDIPNKRTLNKYAILISKIKPGDNISVRYMCSPGKYNKLLRQHKFIGHKSNIQRYHSISYNGKPQLIKVEDVNNPECVFCDMIQVNKKGNIIDIAGPEIKGENRDKLLKIIKESPKAEIYDLFVPPNKKRKFFIYRLKGYIIAVSFFILAFVANYALDRVGSNPIDAGVDKLINKIEKIYDRYK